MKTELATFMPISKTYVPTIDMTELRAPFDGVIGLRQVSMGAYASPTTVIANLPR